MHDPFLYGPSFVCSLVGYDANMLIFIMWVWNNTQFVSWNFSWVLFNTCNKKLSTAKTIGNLLCACRIIVVHVHQIHHFILTLICVSERVTNLEMWSWNFGLCWVIPIFYGLALITSILCAVSSLATSLSTYGLNPIGFPILGSYFYVMEEKEE